MAPFVFRRLGKIFKFKGICNGITKLTLNYLSSLDDSLTIVVIIATFQEKHFLLTNGHNNKVFRNLAILSEQLLQSSNLKLPITTLRLTKLFIKVLSSKYLHSLL